MLKPVILTVDDDPEVLRAIDRDLRKQYGADYRIVRAESPEAALEALRELKLRGDAVAVLLSDQRMPGMNGVEFLEEARKLFPEARRALLTAYADNDAAIKAINSVRVDYYLMKPWNPPQEQLYPVIDDLLDTWLATVQPRFHGIRLIGHRWSPESHRIKDFLARNQVPYQWIDIERAGDDPEHRALVDALESPDCLPVVVFADGLVAHSPSNAEIANRIGLRTSAESPFYDLVIVGGGPAGLAAAVYGASEGLKTLMIEREAPGGQAGMSSRIENYLGFPVGLSGAELARRAVTQARRFGVEVLSAEAQNVRSDGNYHFVSLTDGPEISCHALLIATGVSYRRLEAPGLDRLTGAGVYYGAAMTEALSCKDQPVYIVGGANSAGQAAMYFAQYASHVTLLVRGPSLCASMSSYLIDQIGETPNIQVRPHTSVVEVLGTDNLEQIVVSNSVTGATESLPATGLFVFIGASPRTDWLPVEILRDKNGFLLSGPEVMRDGKRPRGWTADRDPYLLETSIPGIFVAGDVRSGSVKRVASGVGEGSIAISFIHQHLSKVR